MRTTDTYSTTNIVIDAVSGRVWVEDFSRPTRDATADDDAFFDRARHFLNANHISAYQTMRLFTEWLQEMGAVVGKCWILGPELSDEERQHRSGDAG